MKKTFNSKQELYDHIEKLVEYIVSKRNQTTSDALTGMYATLNKEEQLKLKKRIANKIFNNSLKDFNFNEKE